MASIKHRTSDRRYRKRRAKLLAEQDICALCGQWIDPDIKWPDPMSGTADHVIDIAKGGDNHGELQAAHFRCNIRKSNVKPPVRHSRAW